MNDGKVTKELIMIVMVATLMIEATSNTLHMHFSITTERYLIIHTLTSLTN